MNVDVAVNGTGGIIGVGVKILDSEGQVLASNAQNIRAGYITQVAEAMALLHGLRFACDVGLWPCEVESDAQVLVNFVNGKDISCSDVGLIIHDIKVLLKSFPTFYVSFVPIYVNAAAHCLAKFSINIQSDCFWLEVFPPSLAQIVMGECPLKL
ncbi:hypothetical protein Ddye_008854 [Dipteronia dyeriana]|uniref:RNase H type-1 domain-containing protein n=1 Tax=Dipteronia dyeriana TaxID=168575 RepID=A0AAD9XAM2_9ROSI|nr:hypothetical protein Ddye_008854 [Dipteronia dyeriana]